MARFYNFRQFLQNLGVREFVEFEVQGVVGDPTVERARLYFKQADANNNELAVKIKTAGAIQEVVFTSPTGKCSKCDYVGRLKGPVWDMVAKKVIVEFYCGHVFELPITFFKDEDESNKEVTEDTRNEEEARGRASSTSARKTPKFKRFGQRLGGFFKKVCAWIKKLVKKIFS